jgi:hypothetical protein
LRPHRIADPPRSIGVAGESEETRMGAITDNGPFLCVEEVVHLFKISRTKAYKEAQLYIETAGKAGIPAVRIGRSIRFLSEPIERMAAGRVSA